MGRRPKSQSTRPRENNVGENIRYLLQKKGEERGKRISYREFAQAIDVYYKTIYFWIRGDSDPDPELRQRVCDYFDITEAQLFTKGLVVGVPKPKETELTEALLTKLDLPGVGPDDLDRLLNPERKKILEGLIKDWDKQRSQQVRRIRAASTDDRKRILLIDDEARFSATMGKLLTEKGYEVFEAADGEEGLRQVEEVKPQVVLLDLMMDGVDGADFLKRLREKDQETKVIIISSFPEEMRHLYTGQYQIAAYFEKVVNMEDLLDKIAELTGGPA